MLSPRQTTSFSPRSEVARHADDLRDPARLDLHLVGEVEVEELLVADARAHVAVPEQVDELARVLLPGDEQHLAHTRPLQQLQRVVDHRPAADRQQMLVRDARQLLEARRGAAGGDQSLHAADAIAASGSWPRAATNPVMPGEHTDGGDAHPHRRVAVVVAHLQPEERRQRPAHRPGAAERAHVGAADVLRRERGDDRLRRRHPEHLADHEDEDHERDHRARCR